MNDWNYILASDVRTVGIVTTALRHIIPANNLHVPEDEYKTVMRLMGQWQDAMFGEINADPDPDRINTDE